MGSGPPMATVGPSTATMFRMFEPTTLPTAMSRSPLIDAMTLAATSGSEVPTATKLENTLQSGDLFFFLGYYRRPAEAYQVARRAGASIVEVIAGPGDEPLKGPAPDHIIRPWWPYGDAVVSVPNCDIRILPSSGIVQASIYWAVVGAMGVER